MWWADRRFWFGVAISVVCLWLAFRSARWAELAAAVRTVDWTILGLAALAALLDLFLRAVRWRKLLVPISKVSLADSFSFLSIGALANSVLPLRAGEIIRPVLLGEKRHLSKSAVFATVVVERLLDVLALVVLALVLLLVMPIPPAVRNTVVVLGVAGLAALLVLWWVAGRLDQGDRSLPARLSDHRSGERPRRIAGVELRPLLGKGWAMFQSFAGGLAVMRTPRLAASASVYTAAAWGASLLYIWLVMAACHLDLPWTASLMVLVIVNVGAAIPSSPGGLGIVHLLAILALTPWNVEQSQALTFAIMIHAVLLAVVVATGLICLWREGVGLRQLASSVPSETPASSAAEATVALDPPATPAASDVSVQRSGIDSRQEQAPLPILDEAV